MVLTGNALAMRRAAFWRELRGIFGDEQNRGLSLRERLQCSDSCPSRTAGYAALEPHSQQE
jgi:hypothetical protein